jgi:hypothetical protein
MRGGLSRKSAWRLCNPVALRNNICIRHIKNVIRNVAKNFLWPLVGPIFRSENCQIRPYIWRVSCKLTRLLTQQITQLLWMIYIVQVEAANWCTEIQFWFCSMTVDSTLTFTRILRRDTSLFLCELWIYFSNVILDFITASVFCLRHAGYPAIKQQNSLISCIRTHKRTGDKKQ